MPASARENSIRNGGCPSKAALASLAIGLAGLSACTEVVSMGSFGAGGGASGVAPSASVPVTGPDASPMPVADASPMPVADASPMPIADASPMPIADASPMPVVPGPYILPAGFTAGAKGGYRLGQPTTGTRYPDEAGVPASEGCTKQIVGIVRDFSRGDRKGGHPDFEKFLGPGEQNIVSFDLGDDSKPVFAPGNHRFTTTQTNFNQWYRTDDTVNYAYFVYFVLEPNNGVSTFQSDNFFPADGRGFGNEDQPHNFGFTTEVHTTFLYKGGETFTFNGDDDLWIFVNRRLAIDLGGVHPQQKRTLNLDANQVKLNIQPGNVYALDLFHAERHSDQSHFRIDTNLTFIDCSIIVAR
ncbi:MAG TPA: fibro-slime domain-containing protein [Polyangiaceae bacterium]|nr:fibro-slime domain-containing protein [Polyangiaceae bacterium]